MEEIEKYKVESEGFSVLVKIVRDNTGNITYNLILPQLDEGTLALIDELKSELVTEVKITPAEILNIKAIVNLKKKFVKKTEFLLKNILPDVSQKNKKFIIGILLHEMLGLENIEFLLADVRLEEIVIPSSKEPVYVYHKLHGWLKTNLIIENEEKIQNYANIIARRIGKQVNILDPLLDAHLITGDRSNAVLYPIATKGNTITIRKFSEDPWTVTDLINNKTCTPEVFALIWLAVQYELSVLVSGGTASGKTSFLNVCMAFIPPNHRIISIEDTRELSLPSFLFWCPLSVREKNPEGKGEVSMLDLLVNSLRMRPDRIVLGEVRREKHAEVLFEAMHTGHSVYSTIHANSLIETIRRLVNPPINVPSNLLSGVNLNVVMFRDRKKGIRRVYQVGEFVPKETLTDIVVSPNILYRWKSEKDEIISHAKPLRIFEDLSRHTGMSLNDINEDLEIKKKILNWIVKQKIRHVNDVGKVMHKFYLNPDSVIKAAKKNLKLKDI